jgi:hypothetical protein
VERAVGVEPTTSSLGSWHSTTELRPRSRKSRAATFESQISARRASPRGRRFHDAHHSVLIMTIVVTLPVAWLVGVPIVRTSIAAMLIFLGEGGLGVRPVRMMLFDPIRMVLYPP